MKKPSSENLETSSFNAKGYWDARLRKSTGLRATGHMRFSETYNQVMYKITAQRMKALLEDNKISCQGKRILDAGAGYGYFLERCIAWGAEDVVGIDLTSASIAFLRRRFPQGEFIQADISLDLPAYHDYFDLVMAISVLYHIIDPENFASALKNLCRYVSPGGILLLVDVINPGIFPTAKHTRFHPYQMYSSTLSKNQFDLIETRPMLYIMGRYLVPFLGPRIQSLSWILPLIHRLEMGMENIGSGNFGGPMFMLARRNL